MSTQLHQAVQLAQAGQRSEARQLLWQFLQAEPNNEVAWLWLASVAADQGEYRRALNEVLRINPANPRAQQLLADLDRQYGTPPPAAQPYPLTQQSAAPPAASPYTPPPSPVYGQSTTPPPVYGQPASPQPARPMYQPAPVPVEVQVVRTEERRRGCLGCAVPILPGCLGCGGCSQGCLLALLILVVLPAVICGVLTFTPISLGPFDVPAVYLPGEMGRKTIEFTTTNYDVSLKAPRSWYLVQTNDQMWNFWSGFLEASIPFEDTSKAWADLENTAGASALIVEVNPATLAEGGDLIGLALRTGATSGNFDCVAVEKHVAGQSFGYPTLYRYDNDLCGYREQDDVADGPAARVLTNIDPPDQTRTIVFYVPVSPTTAMRWQMSLPENLYSRFADDITALIESVDMTPK